MYSHDARPADLIPDPDPLTAAQAGRNPDSAPLAAAAAENDRDPAPLAAEAAAPEGRRLMFRASGLVVEVEITGTGEAWRLTGRLTPRQSAHVDVRGGITVETDELGRFGADALPAGQLSLRCRLGAEPESAQVTTGWIALRGQ